jgi:hypothetical protein
LRWKHKTARRACDSISAGSISSRRAAAEDSFSGARLAKALRILEAPDTRRRKYLGRPVVCYCALRSFARWKLTRCWEGDSRKSIEFQRRTHEHFRYLKSAQKTGDNREYR